MTISSFRRFMTRIFFASLLTALGLPLAPSVAAAQTCLPSDSISTFVQSKIVVIVTSTDTAAIHLRSVANLPSVAADSIQVVSDSLTCATAAAKLASLTSSGDPNPGAWVFRIGSARYIAFNFRQKIHGSGYLFIYDQSWNRLGSIAF